jgi:hypothetical protein
MLRIDDRLNRLRRANTTPSSANSAGHQSIKENAVLGGWRYYFSVGSSANSSKISDTERLPEVAATAPTSQWRMA